MNGNTITLNNPSPRLNVVGLSNETSAGTIAGLQIASDNLFSADVTWAFEVAYGYRLIDYDIFPSQYLVSGDLSDISCLGNLTWADPTNDILTAFNELMFRSALQTAEQTPDTFNLQTPNGAVNRTFPSSTIVNGQQTLPRNIFLTRYVYLAAATAVMTLGILAVLPTFYGWWHLGRSVSLDPIEVAKAFDAPILGGVSSLSNANVDTLMKNIGKRRIVYGEMIEADGKGERKLTMGSLGPRGVS